MAKVIGPLHSDSASGAYGKTLVFATWKGIKYVRAYVIPANPNTAAQQVIREYFSTAVDKWQTEIQTVKDAWNTYAASSSMAMSGFNFYVQKYIEFLVENTGTPPTTTTTPPNMT